MLRFLLIILITVICACANNDQQAKKQTPQPTGSKYSPAFNRNVDSVMRSYYALTEAFVNWDSSRVAAIAMFLLAKLDSLPQNEIPLQQQRPAAIDIVQAKNDLNVMQLHNSISDKRHALNSLTQNLFNFLQTAGYDGQKLYLQQCPMAFNDTDPGVWLSDRDTIRNPYMGLHHPLYGKAMVECGENKSSVGKGQ